jgi:hypothetical protein
MRMHEMRPLALSSLRWPPSPRDHTGEFMAFVISRDKRIVLDASSLIPEHSF